MASPLSALDQQSLALLISLRDNPDVQKDAALFQLYSDAVSFMTASFPITHSASSVPFIQIDTSGEDGENGFPCTAASFPGGQGMKGTDGSNGQNGRNITLHLMAKEEAATGTWDNGNATVKLGDRSASISLRAIGGKGGKGGDGGKGGTGITGARGKDAGHYSHGTDGKRGGLGGFGGDGGDGGNGGQGGHVKIHVSPEDSDLLMLLNAPEVTGGAKGKGGSKGRGGAGGRGGEGGASFSWTETIQESRPFYDYYQQRSRLEYSTRTVNHHNSGGSSGPDGDEGDDGRIGDDGRAGMDGSFEMIVGGTAYRSLYDLAVTISKIVDLSRGNPTDIYEPGEEINLMVTVINTGGMPTPPQDIEVSLLPTQGIEQRNSSLVLKASDLLPIAGSHTFSSPFSFRVSDQALPNEQKELTYQALLRRVNKSFSRVDQQKDLFSIRYPVQISPLQGTSTLSLFVQNITTADLGKTGPQKRRIFVTFEIAESEDVKSKDVELLKIAEGDLQEPNKITVELDHLSPKSEKSLAVAFRFINPNLPTQSKVGVVASLYLNHFSSDRPRCIQTRMIQMHLV